MIALLPGARRRIVLVDSSPSILSGLATQALPRSDVELETFAQPGQALSRIHQAPPVALVVELAMPDMTGLELTIAARRLVPDLPVVITTSSVTPATREQLVEHKSVEILEKPFSLARLIAAVDRVTHTSFTGFTGTVFLPMLSDLLQLYALSRTTGGLSLSCGDEEGSIWLVGGEIVHASCGALDGDEAIYRLLQWTGGTFCLEPGSSPTKKTIQSSWQTLLLEGYRQMDELREPGAGAQRVAVKNVN